MGGPGFAKLGNQLIKENSALGKLLRRGKTKSGQYPDGKRSLKFKKANSQTKKRILYDKQLLEKQLRFRIALVFLTVIFVALLIILFIGFA